MLREARPLPTAPDDIAVGIPADTLRHRPDVRAAELTLRAEIARSDAPAEPPESTRSIVAVTAPAVVLQRNADSMMV